MSADGTVTTDGASDAVDAPLGYHERFEAERAAGRFVVPWCAECGVRFWHPRSHCPACGSSRIEYTEPTWPAHVYTYTVNHRPKKGDEAAETSMIGYIELDDGLRLLAQLELPDGGEIIGAAVRPQAQHTDHGVQFNFVAATGS